ncbi:MAG: selenocysteine-specific translation elongation factor, partial [Deltaproteobacteria bacterium]|nr:selenocysteine-specific translation elongation factor [Deltaproteobacteria bacterium]
AVLHPIVLGTAGHIDHGKTSLVRALTGIDTDRLPVEKARGITTELGFARLDLGERRIAVVDVPGHERFVKSMVAGATGLDLVCLVIAADEGVMPQTREHLDICDLLGVRRGLVVLTKRDLVDADWLALVELDVREALTGTFLDGAPVIAVSTKDGSGLDELRTAIAAAVDSLPPRTTTGVFRLPVDRIFTVKGFGTIVTGTVLGGEVKVGDELQVLPSRMSVRVRGIEVHGSAVERAVAGHRAAINLGGISVDDLARGDMLAHPDRVAPSHILDVELRHLRTAPAPLPVRSKVLVHHATAQVLATLVLVEAEAEAEAVDEESAPKPEGFAAFAKAMDAPAKAPAPRKVELPPGGRAIAQLRIDATTPLAALPGDHFIVRGFAKAKAQGSTIGGGSIIRVLAPKARVKATHAETVTTLAGARLEQRISVEVRSSAFAGLAIGQLVQRLGIPADALVTTLVMLVGAGDLMQTGDGDHAHYLHAHAIAELEAKIAAQIATAADGVGRELLRTQLPAALPSRAYDAVLAGLETRGLLVTAGDRVSKASGPPRATLSAVEQKLADQLAAWKLEPQRPKDMPTALGLTEPQIKAALDRLTAAKVIVKVKSDLYVHALVLDELRVKLVAFLETNKTIDAQQWKELAGVSRKFSIPLAEHFDAEKLTLRIGDLRRKR